jgi:hypothetical protein
VTSRIMLTIATGALDQKIVMPLVNTMLAIAAGALTLIAGLSSISRTSIPNKLTKPLFSLAPASHYTSMPGFASSPASPYSLLVSKSGSNPFRRRQISSLPTWRQTSTPSPHTRTNSIVAGSSIPPRPRSS